MLSGHVFTIFWCMACLFMAVLFSTKLFSNLTISKLKTGINSLQDLVTQKRNILWQPIDKDKHSDVIAELRNDMRPPKMLRQAALENDKNLNLKKSSWDLLENGNVFLSWYGDVKLHVSEEDMTRELWSITAMNTDCSTGPLARPFARSLAPLTRSLARSLCSLPRSWDSE